MKSLLPILLLLVCFGLAKGQSAWTEPFPGHRIAGNLHYVGSRDLASYLITTSEGHILINSSLEESPKLIRASVEGLGFKFEDIKILLISHAHSDHCAGSAEIIKTTGAQYCVMAEDADAVENGGAKKARIVKGDYTQFPPAKVSRRLKDGDEIKLGGSVLVARKTAGHTPGCTTWTMQVDENGKKLHAVIIGSPNVNPGYILVGNKTYPEIATDYERTFALLKALPVDLFLGAHGGYYGMEAKHKLIVGRTSNPFVDPAGYHAYVDDREKAFRAEWEKQKAKP
ncbi:MAG: subclass B3 metallo-beta-lactamase [Verrucomicrobiaceae bacterium]